MPRVLVVEDERKMLRALERALHDGGYEVVTAADGELGCRFAISEFFDCIVLDLLLPGRGGLDVLAEVRRAGKTVPVLILTAQDGIEDRVMGLDAGADDYLVKPFSLAELLARLRVLLRRDRSGRETILRADDLEVDVVERRVVRNGTVIALSHREFELLEYLLRHKNTVVTRAMLGRDVWKEDNYALTNVIDVCITYLRRKVELPGIRPLIHTLRGLGYSLRG
jgi:DNA-binding response OmpR family regulator